MKNDNMVTLFSIAGMLGLVLLIIAGIATGSILGFMICFGAGIAVIKLFIALAEESMTEETKKALEEQERLQEFNKKNGGYKCPNCGMSAGHEISAFSKATSIGMIGIASNKIGKTYKCNNCGYMW